MKNGMKNRIILASASPRRAELLRQMGIDAEIIPSGMDETFYSSDPETMVRKLSEQKAREVASRVSPEPEKNCDAADALSAGGAGGYPYKAGAGNAAGYADKTETGEKRRSAAVIGADTVVAIDGRILGKPRDHEEARRMIAELSGRWHQVFTGVTVIFEEEERNFAVRTSVHVVEMSYAEIKAYADSDEPMDKAGAYGIQGLFGRYIDRIDGDYFNVVGLPLSHVYAALKEIGALRDR